MRRNIIGIIASADVTSQEPFAMATTSRSERLSPRQIDSSNIPPYPPDPTSRTRVVVSTHATSSISPSTPIFQARPSLRSDTSPVHPSHSLSSRRRPLWERGSWAHQIMPSASWPNTKRGIGTPSTRATCAFIQFGCRLSQKTNHVSLELSLLQPTSCTK